MVWSSNRWRRDLAVFTRKCGQRVMYVNHLALEQFRQLLQYNPYRFWGLRSDRIRNTSKCNPIIAEYAYQLPEQIGRAAIRNAITQAETKLAQLLRYPVAPTYYEHTNSTFDFTQPLPHCKLVKLGLERYEILSTLDVTLADVDGNNVYDTFTTSAFALPANVPFDDLRIMFVSNDRSLCTQGGLVHDRWRIDATMQIAGSNAQFTGKAWHIVKPNAYEAVPFDPINADVIDPRFATQVLLVRKWYDPTMAYQLSSGGYSTFVPVEIVDPQWGYIDLARGACIPWQRFECTPQHVLRTVHYVAGVPYAYGEIDEPFKTAVFRLALAELARPLCMCEGANKEQEEWQTDLSRTDAEGAKTFGTVTLDDLANPLGTRRGHVAAWKVIKQFGLDRAIAI
jgi:hypothetical protein